MTTEERRLYTKEYYQKNKEHIKAKSREHRQKNKEKNRERRKLYAKEYRQKNRERIKAYQQARRSLTYAQNRKRLEDPVKAAREAQIKRDWLRKQWHVSSEFKAASIQRNKEWRKKNPDKVKAYKQKDEKRRRAAKLGVDESFSKEQSDRVFAQFGNACFLCGDTEKLCLDHHLPLIAGFPLEFGNAVVLCTAHNCRKNSKHPSDFYTTEELSRLERLLEEQRGWV